MTVIVLADPESVEISRQLNGLLSKVEEMRSQRETLEEQLRKSILEDDITGALCKQEGVNKQVLFISYKFVKGFLAITFLLLLISC